MTATLKSMPSPDYGPEIQQAMVMHRQGNLREAECVYAAILAAEPGQFDALHLLGLAKHQQGHALEALRLIAAALKINPDSPDALSNYGLVLDALKRHQEAIESFDKALALRRDHANALNNRGLTLATLGRAQEALASWDQALAVDPDHLDALHNRGNALRNLRRLDAALADYQRVLAARPDNLDVLNNCGGSLAELGRWHEAVEYFDRALAINPKQPELFINKGNALADLRQFDEALSCYAEAAAIEGRRAEAKWYESLVRLRLGQFARGWRDYEWRWQQASWASRRRDFVEPLWLGEEPIAGRTILLHAEQGFGDTIQFVRYAKRVARLGPRVLLEVQPSLKALLSGVAGVAATFARGEPLPAFDLHCPLMSLALALGSTLDTIPADIPYLFAPSDRIAKWRDRLGEARSLRVGIAWAGNAAHRNDQKRSIALQSLAALLSTPGIEFVSIQSEIAPADAAALRRHADMVHIGSDLRDFADTAAAISLLDLIVSVDTSVVHLAGALGKPVWVLLPFVSDFRWLLEREDSPWYPTARLFRQPRFGDWDSVLARVRHELGALGKSGGRLREH